MSGIWLEPRLIRLDVKSSDPQTATLANIMATVLPRSGFSPFSAHKMDNEKYSLETSGLTSWDHSRCVGPMGVGSKVVLLST